MSLTKDYRPVSQTSLDEVSNNDDEKGILEAGRQERRVSRFKIYLIILLLTSSLTTNIFLFGLYTSKYFGQHKCHVKSKYGELTLSICFRNLDLILHSAPGEKCT